MHSLDVTTKTGTEALDEAVKACSSGQYTSMQQIINSFVSAVSSYGAYSDTSAKAFLLKYCGINLDNTDTGSIIGADAGGSSVYTPDSIISETGSMLNVARNCTSYTIDGVTFTWSSSLTDTEAAIINRICSWWAKGAMDLVYKAYGIKYTESDSMGQSVKINFTHAGLDSYSAQAGASWSGYVGGSYTANLSININMDYYDYIDINDPNGDAKVQLGYIIYSGGMLDRVLAHEITHSIMQAVVNPSSMTSLPQFIKEGLAELAHGIDDERTSDILYLAQNPYTLNSALDTSNTGTGSIYCYSGGYMLLRYMAQQLADGNEDTGLQWNSAKTSVVIGNGFTEEKFRAWDYDDSLVNIDASAVTRTLKILGNDGNNIIKASSGGGDIDGWGGNDTIYLGIGHDSLYWYSDEGNDTVYNFNVVSDDISVYEDLSIKNIKDFSYKVAGNDIIITNSKYKSTLTLKNSNTSDVKNYLERKGIAAEAVSSLVWSNGNADVKINSTYTASSFDGTKYPALRNIDASSFTKALTIKGNSNANVIRASAGESVINAGKGNDTIYAGAGTDTIQYASGEGADNIYNLSASDKIKFVSDSLKSIAAASTGNDVVITTTNGGKMTLKANTGKTINVVNSAGTTTKYMMGRNDADNTYTWASGVRFVGTGKKDTLNVKTGGANIDLTNTTLYKSIDVVNASSATSAVTIKGGATKSTITGSSYADKLTGANVAGSTVNGGAGNDTIIAGTKGNTIDGGTGNDTITAGAGTDTILIKDGMGTDTITGFSASDRIKVSSGTMTSIASASTGTDVTVTAGTGKAVIKAGTGKIIQVMDSTGAITKYMLGRNDADNSYTWASGVRFIGTAKKDTINLKTGGATVDLTNTTLYKSIDAVSASSATSAVTIKGGAQAVNITGSAYNDTIKAGSKGGTITGGKGNDTITAGAGVDTIVIADGMGTDTITGFTASDKIKVTSASYSLAASGSDVIVTAGSGKAVIKSGIGKNIQVVDKEGVTTKYSVGKKDTANTFTWASGMNYVGSSKTDTVNVNTGGANADLSKSSSIENINASKATTAVTIKGGAYAATITGSAYADKITAGSKGGTIRAGKGNDTIYAGAGTDTIQYASGEGSDTIYNLSASDKIKFVSDSLKSIAAASTGTDVVITTANGGKMTLKATTGKTVNVVNSAGTTIKYVLGRNDANNTFTWASGVRFIGTAKTDTLNVNTGGANVDLTNTTLYKSIDAVNASSATSAVTIKGGAQKVNITGSAYADTLTGANVAGGTVSGGAGNDTIRAGSKGGTLIGGKGNDKIYAGAGADIIKFAAGDGNDTVYNYSSSADKIQITSGGVTGYSVVNGKGVITTTNGTITLSGYAEKNISVYNNAGVETVYSAQSNYTGTSSKDTFVYYVNNDVNITGFANGDTIKLADGEVAGQMLDFDTGKDLIFYLGKSMLTAKDMMIVKDATDKIITVVDKYGNKGTYFYPAYSHKDFSYTDSKCLSSEMFKKDGKYWVYDLQNDISSLTYDETGRNKNSTDVKIINATNVGYCSYDLTVMKASASSSKTIIANAGGGVWNGVGNKNIRTDNNIYYGGFGADTFVVGGGATIYSYTGAYDRIKVGTYKSGATKPMKVIGYAESSGNVLLRTEDGGTITVIGTKASDITMIDSNGSVYTDWRTNNRYSTTLKAIAASVAEPAMPSVMPNNDDISFASVGIGTIAMADSSNSSTLQMKY